MVAQVVSPRPHRSLRLKPLAFPPALNVLSQSHVLPQKRTFWGAPQGGTCGGLWSKWGGDSF